MASTAFSSTRDARVATRSLPIAALVGGGAAALANLVVFALASVAGVSFVFAMSPGTPAAALPAWMVVVTSAAPAVGAAILLALLDRLLRRPFRAFLIIAAVFLALSLGGPLSLPADLPTRLVLSLMHIVAGVAIVGALARLARKG